MFSTPLGRFRAVALAEGWSYVVLLLVAMPLKYLAGMPEAVGLVGRVHGMLFVLYVAALLYAGLELRWSLKKMAVAFVASVIPLGAFVLDRRLREEARAQLAVGQSP